MRIARPAAIVTDIEGTTSDIAFVQQVLFPYARAALPEYLQQSVDQPEVAKWVHAVADEIGVASTDLDAVTSALIGWIDADRKHTALKALQGQIWQRGFAEGAFQAHVYADAVTALKRWHELGIPLYVYSSGSIQAQKLYFAHTEAGDLSTLFRGHFDTMIGAKREAESYRRIQQDIGIPAASILFLSDIGAELDAARECGWQTVQLLRPGSSAADGHSQVAGFDAIDFH